MLHIGERPLKQNPNPTPIHSPFGSIFCCSYVSVGVVLGDTVPELCTKKEKKKKKPSPHTPYKEKEKKEETTGSGSVSGSHVRVRV